MLEAVCPNGHRLQVPLEHAGMKLRCPAPGCGIIFQLSATSPTGSTLAVGPSASGTALPSTAPAAPAGAAAAPSTTTAAAAQPQSSQTYGTVPLAPATTQTAADAAAGRWSGSDPAPAAATTQPAATQQPAPAQTVVQPTTPVRNVGPTVAPRSGELSGGALLAGAQAILMLGLVLVLTARGCDGLGARNISRLKARVLQDEQHFEGPYQVETKAYNAELADDKITDKRKNEVLKSLEDLRKAHEKERRLSEAKWAENQNAATEAVSSNMMWGYWREMLFVAGTILLSLGLTAVAFAGHGVERYLCFGLLAIIVFSVYVGGAAWFTSIVGGLSGVVPSGS
ncbi:MAG: hypothetical protein K8U03_23970 [Planctomycetia bacterium]|nr:hypothetical protein [Planctomycetia bacterium]